MLNLTPVGRFRGAPCTQQSEPFAPSPFRSPPYRPVLGDPLPPTPSPLRSPSCHPPVLVDPCRRTVTMVHVRSRRVNAKKTRGLTRASACELARGRIHRDTITMRRRRFNLVPPRIRADEQASVARFTRTGRSEVPTEVISALQRGYCKKWPPEKMSGSIQEQ
jgi:hypothetical protein